MENNALNILNEMMAKEAAIEQYNAQKEQELKTLNDTAEQTILDKVILPIIEQYKIKTDKNTLVECDVMTRECDVCHKISPTEEMYLYAGKTWCKDCLCNLLMYQMKFKKIEPFVYNKNNPRPQRPNESCTCGSGKKYKKCCGAANKIS